MQGEINSIGIPPTITLGCNDDFFWSTNLQGIGFGKEIALGSARLTAKYGQPDLSMSVKGQEFPAYDGRVIQGIGLAYATSNRGFCHLRGYTIASEVLGIPVKTELCICSLTKIPVLMSSPESFKNPILGRTPAAEITKSTSMV